jgi:S1-C subfamily serine protease
MKALIVLMLVAVVAGGWAYRHERNDVARLDGELRAMKRDLGDTRRENTVLADRLRSLTRGVRSAQVARTTLAARIRASVFTVTASLDEGSGFIGWVSSRNSYVITANHVIILSVHHGDRAVRVHRGTSVWRGRVIKTDSNNDLALIRVPGRIGAPLWQSPVYVPPLVGDALMLVGSPNGYEGSVTSGIVGRVAPMEIQTDAAAYPGISGGPAVDSEGQVVGVLVSGEAENLNFAVPIDRACVKIRPCPTGGRKKPAH